MNSTLVMVAVLAAVAMLSAAVVVVPIQQASAQDTDFDFKQKQSNKCSGFSECTNEGIIVFGGAVICYEHAFMRLYQNN
jgi:hypothetical protein